MLAFAGLCLLYCAALPFYEGFDERAHLLYVDYIATHAALPDLNQPLPSHEATQPPLYHLLAAWLIAGLVQAGCGSSPPARPAGLSPSSCG